MPTYKSQNFSHVKGDNKTVRITVKDPDGEVVDLTSYQARFTVKKNIDDTTYILRKATSGISGGASSQMLVYDAEAGLLDVYILKTDFLNYAYGTITAIAANSITNNEGFTLTDTLGNAVVFKFSKDSGAVTGQNATVSITTGQTADQVAAAIQAVVNAWATFVATVNLSVVTVTQAIPGADGNTTSADTVVNTGFVVTNLSSGSDSPAAGVYHYDVELQAPSTENVNTVVLSTITLLDEITNWKKI
jgi:hypothetical protein